jgi:hypothetical protein
MQKTPLGEFFEFSIINIQHLISQVCFVYFKKISGRECPPRQVKIV